MALLHRMNRSRLKLLSQQFKRHYIHIPFDSSPKCAPSSSRSYAVENPCWGFCRRTTEFCYNVRFFAAPVQQKVIKEEYKGPRLNDKITARFVRLVIGDEHSVVSLGEALQQATKLELDLVEVDRTADPPVCKIMDYHKEKYLQEMKAKELAKKKAGVSLRKGSFKEVRFSVKAEDKDIKTKADSVLRLMERGYRVKCIALGSNKKGADPGDAKDHGLVTLLSRITSLIEDVAVVESEQKMENNQAYIIVRHTKFGPIKKGATKKLKHASKVANGSEDNAVFEDDDAESGVGTDNDHSTDEEDILVNDRSTGSFVDSSKGFGTVFNFSDGANVPYANPSKDGNGIPESRLPSSTIQPSVAAENRYKRNESRNQFLPTPPVANGMDRRGQYRIEPQFSNQRRPSQAPINTGPFMGDRRQAESDKMERRGQYRIEPQFSNQRSQAQAPINAGPFVGDRRQAESDTVDRRGQYSIEPQFSNQRGQTQAPNNAGPFMGDRSQAESDTSFRNFRQPSNEAVNQTSPSVSSNTRSSSYGIFSSSNPSPPTKSGGEREIDKVAEGNRYSSQRPSFDGSQRMRINNGGQGGSGVFRSDGRNNPN